MAPDHRRRLDGPAIGRDLAGASGAGVWPGLGSFLKAMVAASRTSCLLSSSAARWRATAPRSSPISPRAQAAATRTSLSKSCSSRSFRARDGPGVADPAERQGTVATAVAVVALEPAERVGEGVERWGGGAGRRGPRRPEPAGQTTTGGGGGGERRRLQPKKKLRAGRPMKAA